MASSEPHLSDPSSWPDWYNALQSEAAYHKIWNEVNPDTPDPPGPLSEINWMRDEPPSRVTFESIRTELIQENQQLYLNEMAAYRHETQQGSNDTIMTGTETSNNVNKLDPHPIEEPLATPMTSEPTSTIPPQSKVYPSEPQLSPDPTNEQIYKYYIIREKDNRNAVLDFEKHRNHHLEVFKFIARTIDNTLMAQIKQSTAPYHPTVKETLVFLKRRVAPSLSAIQSSIHREYEYVLAQARNGRVNSTKWYKDWSDVYGRARAYNVTEVETELGIKNFVKTIGKFYPQWSEMKYREIQEKSRKGIPFESLTSLGETLGAMITEDALEHRSKVFSTIEAPISTTSTPAQLQYSKNRQGRNFNGSTKKILCPCRPTEHWSNGKSGHPWPPESCRTLEMALTGRCEQQPDKQPLPPNAIKEITSRIHSKHWAELRGLLTSKGWMSNSTKSTKSPFTVPRDNSDTPSFTAVTMSSQDLAGVFAIRSPIGPQIDFEGSTLLDNCGSLHLVNDRALLETEGYRLSGDDDLISSGLTSNQVTGRGTRIMENIISWNGKKHDLVLHNVAYVPGFHVNIVSEALLTANGMWLCGLDATLRKGTLEKSKVIAECKRHNKLVFLELKLASSYSFFTLEIPVSHSNLMFPTTSRRLNRAYHRSRDPPPVREDTADVWHERSGHLGKDALEHLVDAAIGVKIKGKIRKECEECARTHAKQIISRAPGDRQPPRPFYKIQWDLFDFPTSYTRASWLLIIKETFTGKIFCYFLPNRSHDEVFGVIKSFFAWVFRKYGLSIVVVKQDNDTSVIGIQGKTIYQEWIYENGIELELSPSHTHESNGGAERAGQEVITKQIKMMASSGLPDTLWTEVTLAASYLYNISPLKAKSYKSPNQILDEWFRVHLKEHDDHTSTKITDDLRPNWSGIYRYGCRAYPLDKEREAGTNRKWYKTHPRAHIGYLVGYIPGSKIYRIWIPMLAKVIVSRNVEFDENHTYKSDVAAKEVNILTRQEYKRAAYELDDLRTIDMDGTIIQNEDDLQETTVSLGSISLSPYTARTSDAPLASSGSSGVEHLGGDNDANTDPQPPNTDSPTPNSPQNPDPDNGSGPTSLKESQQISAEHNTIPEAKEKVFQELTAPDLPPPTIGTEDKANQGEEMESEPTGPAIEVFRSEYKSEPNSPKEPLLKTNKQVEYEIEELSPSPPPQGTRRAIEESSRNEDSFFDKSIYDFNYNRRKRQKTLQIEIPRPSLNPLEYQQFTDEEIKDFYQPFGHNLRQRHKRLGYHYDKNPNPSAAHFIGTVITQNTGPRGKERLDDFHATFWPDNHDFDEFESRNQYVTIHNVIAAAIHTRVSSIPPTINIRMDELPRTHLSKAPKLPRNFRDLSNHPLGIWFKKNCDEEINNLKSRDTWHEIDKGTEPIKPIPLSWVFNYKTDNQGMVTKCRSRLVVRGDLQAKSTIEDTYAATLASRSFRIMMAIIAKYDLETKQYDVVNAFVNAHRNPEGVPVVCYMPDGYQKIGKYLVLDRALYGLRDSPAIWFREFTTTLRNQGMVQCKEEPCIYRSTDHKVIVLFFVDDVQIIYHKSNEKLAEKITKGIEDAYELRTMGDTEWFLGIRIIRDRGQKKLWLAHDTYIEKIAKKFKCTQGNAGTPLPTMEFKKNEGVAPPWYVKIYQEKTGSILYTAITIRVDIAFAASQLSHFLTNPSEEHMKAVDHCIVYLWNTRFLAIAFCSSLPPQLMVFSDASFADDQETRRSSQGYIMSLFGGAVIWKASRQDTVTTSTTEAELLGVERTSKETMATLRLLREMDFAIKAPVTIFCDNMQAIRLIVGENERITTKLRHVDIQNMWLRQEYAKGSFTVTYLPTAEMTADGLTKNLSRQKHEHFRSLLNLQDISGRVKPLLTDQAN